MTWRFGPQVEAFPEVVGGGDMPAHDGRREDLRNLLDAYRERGAMIAHLVEKVSRLERENAKLREQLQPQERT